MIKKILSLAVMLLITAALCSALSVGLNDDVHFDYPNLTANDFHIEGTIYSKGEIPKVVDIIIFGDGGHWYCTGYSMKLISQDKYYFTVDFKLDGLIKFCQWIHFGIKLNVEAYNVIVDLKGYWTLNGVRITRQISDVPVTGFIVDDINMLRTGAQTIRLTNSTGLPVSVIGFEIATSSVDIPLKDLFTTGLGRIGEQSPKYPELKWIKVPLNLKDGVLTANSSIDIPLENIGFKIEPGTFLLMRGQQINPNAPAPLSTASTFNNNPDWGYFWEIHEAPR